MRLSVCFSCCSSVVYQYLGAHPAHFGCRQTQRAHQSVTNINCYPSRFLCFSIIFRRSHKVCVFFQEESQFQTLGGAITPPRCIVISSPCCVIVFPSFLFFFSSPSSALEIVLEVPLGVCAVGGIRYIFCAVREKRGRYQFKLFSHSEYKGGGRSLSTAGGTCLLLAGYCATRFKFNFRSPFIPLFTRLPLLSISLHVYRVESIVK